MNAIHKFATAASPFAELAGRILLAVMFLYWGMQKLGGGYAGTQAYMEAFGVAGFLLPLVIVLEIVGAIMLIVGWLTRWFSVALAGFSLLAGLIFHTDFSDLTQTILFSKNIALTGALLLLACAGAGHFSVDRMMQRRHKA